MPDTPLQVPVKVCLKGMKSGYDPPGNRATYLKDVDNELDEFEKALKKELSRMQEEQDGKWKLHNFIQQLQEKVDSKIQKVYGRMESNLQQTKDIYKGESEIEKLERTLLSQIWEKHQLIESETKFFWNNINYGDGLRYTWKEMLYNETKKIHDKNPELDWMAKRHLHEIENIQSSQQCKIEEMEAKYDSYQMKRTEVRLSRGTEKVNEIMAGSRIQIRTLSPFRILKGCAQTEEEARRVQRNIALNTGVKREPEYCKIGNLKQVKVVDNLMHNASNLEIGVSCGILEKSWAEEENMKSTSNSGAHKELTEESENQSIDDIETGKMVNTLNHNTVKLQELQNIDNVILEDIAKLRDNMNLNILEMKTNLRELQNKQNLFDMTKWQYSLQEIKTEFSDGIDERVRVNFELLQDKKQTIDRMQSNMLMAKVKLSKIRSMWSSAAMKNNKASFDQYFQWLSEGLQERKNIKSEFQERVTSLQRVVSQRMQEMEIDMKSQLQKMLNLDINLVQKAKSNKMCPLDMTPEKWKLGLEDLGRELLEDIRANHMRIKSELKILEDTLSYEEWKPTLETMKKTHLSEIKKIENKYSELELLEKSLWKEMHTNLQEAQQEPVHDDQIENDPAQEETEKYYLFKISQMIERKEKVETSIDVLRKMFEPVDLKMQEIQKRIHLRQTKMVHRSLSAIESREKALVYDMWMAREDLESEMKKCFEEKDVQAWISALQRINFEKIKDMYSVHSDWKIKGNAILDQIKRMQVRLDSNIRKVQREKEKVDLFDPSWVKKMELEDIEVLMKSHMEEKLACGELNIIFTEMKSREVSKNLNISKLQTMLETTQEVILQWEEQWKDLQSKHHESKQEVGDASKRMRDLKKALLEESDMMHERQVLKREFFELLKEKPDKTDFSYRDNLESQMFKLWSRQEVKDVQSAMEQINWENLSNIQEVWTLIKLKEESGIFEIKNSFKTLLESIDEKIKKLENKFQYHQEKKDNIAQKKKTKAYEKDSANEEYREKQRMKLDFKDIKEMKAAKDLLQKIKTGWNQTESEIENMQENIWPALGDEKLKSALERLKLVHSKEKQRIKSAIEHIEKA